MALWFCVVVNGCYLPKAGREVGFYYENCLENTESSKIKLERLRAPSLSRVHVSFESPRQVMVIRGSVFLKTLFFGVWGWIFWYPTIPRNVFGARL